MKRNIILTVGLLALGVIGWWLTRSDRVPSFSSDKQALVDNSRPTNASTTALAQGAMTATSDTVKRSEVASVFEELKKQYAYAGALNWDEAKALIAKRDQAAKALVDRLAALGSGGAAVLNAAYSQSADMREKMLLIAALGRIKDDQASGILQNLIASETSFSLQRELISALSHRSDTASTDALAGLLTQPPTSQSDSQIQFAAAQALSGRETALSMMVESVSAGSNADVQKELVLSIGAIGTPAAMQALTDIAQNNTNPSVRQAAIQELSRKFGDKALNALGHR
jgi:HEAT repeat protein